MYPEIFAVRTGAHVPIKIHTIALVLILKKISAVPSHKFFWFCNSADDVKIQYVSVRRKPEGFDHIITVFWDVVYNANFTGVTTNSTVLIFFVIVTKVVTCCVLYKIIEQKIGFIIAKQATVPGEDKYKWFTLNLTMCNSSNPQVCTPVYPSILRMRVDITGGGDALHETKTQKEMPKWLWWLIGGLVIFAAILALLGYRYWWKHKQTSGELLETEDQLEHALEENELGFGRDLGIGDVQFNPMATGVPGQTKAPELFGGELDKRSKDASNVRADVAVEKFAHREQFGQQQGMKRPNGGNDLSQPLLG
ncbi:hypothetical protein RFI_07022 [Reticulomyxa filosa]|uniref:Uncharacterized protein n=1 Tax=Reticulomyxa filosa TaxID=46433 RepID=X6NW96_RETFI|nr:hypothetical protein RFI_07022 [Reticulomyxa filosa]|eukprot:ETO30099.1 hypothetical protein RFI_07022 [Reticulomyxa filosa]